MHALMKELDVLHRGAIVLDRYVILSLIARGAMGVVFGGEHRLLKRPVAIKVLKDAADEATRQRFEREGRVLAQVQHPHIVAILDFGFLEDGRPCIVMEHLEGGTLEAYLAQRERLPWQEALGLILQLLKGLGALHDHQILHRDIKTDNIILLQGQPLGQIKLIDLGIARGPLELGMRLTRTGMVMGSPAYMAPELLRGEQATVASELYAVGLVFYELIYGQLPFGSQTFADVMRRLDEPLPTFELPIPEGLVEVLIGDLLNQSPEQRPKSVAHTIELLSPWAS